MHGHGARLEDEEVQLRRDARHGFQDPVEPPGERQPQRQRQRTPEADNQRRLAEHVGHDAALRETERAERGDFSEPLVDRDRQQHRDEEEREGQGDRDQDRRDLPEVRELGLLQPRDDLARS